MSAPDAPLPPRPRRGPRLSLSLRWTLLIALLPLLTLPWVGLRFVERMSELMRNDRLGNLAMTASSLAGTLHERRTLFEAPAAGGPPERAPADARPVPVALLAQIHADGRADDWRDVPRQSLAVTPQGDAQAATLAPRIALARSQEDPGTLTLRIETVDERLVPPMDDTGAPAPGDRVRIDSGELPDTLHSLMLAAHPPAPDAPAARLTATADGWFAQVTLRGDPSLLRIRIEDVDYLGSRKLEAVAESGLLAPQRPRRVADEDGRQASARASAWAQAGQALLRAPGRLTVHDAGGTIVYRHDGPPEAAPAADDWTTGLARSILAAAARSRPEQWFGQRARGPADDPAAPSPLAIALSGKPAERAQPAGERAGLPTWRLTSAHPIWIGERVAGALVIEEPSTSRHAPGQRALERLALLAALAVAATVGSLLLIATLTVGRIVRLRNQADAAIDARGRVIGAIPDSRLGDELGDLGRGYQRVLDRLREHQDYLGNLRSRLVHELRTPIMVVRSSLENLAAADDPQQREACIERVRLGAERLERIVSSMGEASSLEAMLADSRLETVKLGGLLEGCVTGYRGAFANHRFALDTTDGPHACAVVPEAIVQALDKLVSNAVDFAPAGSTIRVSLAGPAMAGRGRQATGWQIAVTNAGPPLPQTMQASLFDSMVSVRSGQAGGTAHLGLGLYLVRLIAEFHGGHAFAHNVPGGVTAGLVISTRLSAHQAAVH